MMIFISYFPLAICPFCSCLLFSSPPPFFIFSLRPLHSHRDSMIKMLPRIAFKGMILDLSFFFIVVAVLLPISFVVYLLYVLTRYIPLIAPKTSETERFNGDNYNNLPFQSLSIFFYLCFWTHPVK